MITYNRSAFGWRLIFRIHGSAVYRSVLPALFSVLLYFMFEVYYDNGKDDARDLLHPYAVGVLVAGTTFLIVFKLNQGYNRYWEACSSVYQMVSKWIDATTHTSVYHMQCDHYTHIKPPTFYDYPELNYLNMTRDRERGADYEEYDYIASPSEGEDNDDDNDDDHRKATAAARMRQKLPTTRGLRQRRQQNSSRFAKRRNSNSDAKSDGDGGLLPPRPPGQHVISTPSTDNTFKSGVGDKPGSSSAHDSSAGSSGIANSEESEIGASTRRKIQRKKREVRSIVKSINYIENPEKRERAKHLYQSTDLVGASAGGVLGQGSTLLHGSYDSGDDDDDSLNVSESLFFSNRLAGRGGGNGQEPIPLWGTPRLDGNWGKYFTVDRKHPVATYFDPNNPEKTDAKGFASMQGGHTPPLFLQELAHLASLLIAVALSTLRNDIDGSESPLAIYEPGKPWPEVDPAKAEPIKMDNLNSFCTKIKAFLSIGKTAEEQTRWNAARPLPVIGGVSDAEIRFLQIARGPYAKTQLCWNWLSEFIMREHLAGSLGKVGPPIISRIIQFLGDGMIYYNHARKIMFIPFPFAHAQISVLFVVVLMPAVPFLMDQYTDERWLGAVLTFFTVLCMSGINEVSRELENPFRNVPNELPLVTFQAQANEALFTMYAGYHPDFFWDGDRVLRHYSNSSLRSAAPSPSHQMDLSTHPKTDCKNNGPAVVAYSEASPVSRSKDPSAVPRQSISHHTNATQAPSAIVESSSASTKTSISPAVYSEQSGRIDKPKSEDTEDLSELKRQLETQSKVIERLLAKVDRLEN